MLRALDSRLLRLMRTRWHGQRVERAIAVYSRAGEHGVLWHGLAAAGLLVDARRRSTYLHCMRAVLITYGANTAVKYVFRRARPVLEELPWLAPTVSGHSYPSAHSSMAFAAARSLSDAMPRPPLYVAATAMALTRPYLGVHYPSDVLAGAGLGDAVARLVP